MTETITLTLSDRFVCIEINIKLQILIFIAAVVFMGFVDSVYCFTLDNRFGLIKEDQAQSLKNSFSPSEEWSGEKLAQAMLYAEEIGSSAIVVFHKGRLVLEWGKTTLRIKSHSMRKSLLSALYGIAVEKNLISLSSTLAELGIDDRPPVLTPEEKKATIEDLLKARSGVFHPAAAEHSGMKNKRPLRGAFGPGEHWYYNNWDFNVLGTIFERKTNITIDLAFKQWIADPIGMQDFRPEDVHFEWEPASIHPSYPIWITARDLARFGQLYLQEGCWEGKQIIPASWIKESITPYSKSSNEGFGYMWWVRPSGAYYAAGYFGQKVLILPKHQVVIVNSVFTGTPSFNQLPPKVLSELTPLIDPVEDYEFRRLVELIIKAALEK